ncbi:MAG: hypothetical protein JWN70_2705 [Planctomycetaceae bacterium]|nr:hypothetical protein [Planctomycetaceae bacterium]
MSGDVTLCFYLVIGACVAVALWIGNTDSVTGGRTFRACTALLFWPFYLPMLLVSKGAQPHGDNLPPNLASEPVDEMTTAIAQVEIELDTALCSLNGWAEETLCAEAGRFAELRSAWRQQAERIRELDRLLSAEANDKAQPDSTSLGTATQAAPTMVADSSSANRITTSEQSRRENLTKLQHVREQWHGDLLATLAWVRQLVTMIHLARYTGEPASRAAELVQQIAKAVEGLSKGSSPGLP